MADDQEPKQLVLGDEQLVLGDGTAPAPHPDNARRECGPDVGMFIPGEGIKLSTSPAFDYKDMILKYMAHVGEYEGVDFIQGYSNEDLFTDEEWAEMQRLAKL